MTADIYGGLLEENNGSSGTQALLQVHYMNVICELSPWTREAGKVCGPFEFWPHQSTKLTTEMKTAGHFAIFWPSTHLNSTV